MSDASDLFVAADGIASIGGREFEMRGFSVSVTNPTTAAYTDGADLRAPADITVEHSVTMEVDEATYARLHGIGAAPRFSVSIELGEQDPFYERPTRLDDVLRQMWRIVSYEVRKAAGRTLSHAIITLPAVRWE